ncbi:hypothetical protein MTO96_009826 [Rhipicephalus appendiculatus]
MELEVFALALIINFSSRAPCARFCCSAARLWAPRFMTLACEAPSSSPRPLRSVGEERGAWGELRGLEPREREGKCPRCGSGRPAISDPDTSLRPGTVASTAASLAPCVVWAQLPTVSSPRPFAGPPPHPVLLT